ncbi:SAM-dependent methyltransferase [Sphingomonas spermidinifaciens]|uniref:SAM-dependent methyltransferase n=1 Tax=Sphingomonas spermidinifaciens TaxID=1141889 RepID=A0A2A4B5B6_9SPHN|nr:methyltransferase domain-containing protein [Sphingomonas spermidinifaciens]PCD03257.1 SAM-dependent methyltransferase [Sphingomonas spermidinifaciens]
MKARASALLLAAFAAGCATPIPPLPPGADPGARPAREPDIYYEPSPPEVVEAMLKLAGVGPGDTVVDLGSGDGRIPIAAATVFGARGRGIELDPRLVAVARANAARAGVADRVSFEEGDIFKADLSGATVVTLFLQPGINRRLSPKLRAELPPGARIVSHYHDGLRGWAPAGRSRSRGRPLYLWIVPPRQPASR